MAGAAQLAGAVVSARWQWPAASRVDEEGACTFSSIGKACPVLL